MKVGECMTRDVRTLSPDDTIQDAARLMAECDFGAVPVAESDRLVGMVTDRDIVVRAVGEGRGANCKLRDVMSAKVLYCFDDEDARHVARNMADVQVRRLPVVNRDKRLVGILAIGDLAFSKDVEGVGVAVCGISRPGGETSQSAAH